MIIPGKEWMTMDTKSLKEVTIEGNREPYDCPLLMTE